MQLWKVSGLLSVLVSVFPHFRSTSMRRKTDFGTASSGGRRRAFSYICRIILRSRVAVCPPRRSQRRRMCQHSKFAPREYFKHQSETTETKSEDPDSRVASTSTSELILFSANWNINLDTPLLTLPTQSVSPFATLIVCKWTTPSTSPLLELG